MFTNTLLKSKDVFALVIALWTNNEQLNY